MVQVDNRTVVTDTQALTISNSVEVEVGNSGSTDIGDPFGILLFQDVNEDNQWTEGTDSLLGQGQVNNLNALETVHVSISVTGALDFRDDLIYALVDSQNQIAEGNETNNLGHSGQASKFHPKPGIFAPKLKWAWDGESDFSKPHGCHDDTHCGEFD